MKFIYYTNTIVLGLTILGYSMIYPGILMQIPLGGIQVLFFFVLLFNYDKFSKKIKKHLAIYGLVTSCYLLLIFADHNISIPSIGIAAITLVPMSIAIYFTYIIHKLKTKVL